jgi:hypothetical protein
MRYLLDTNTCIAAMRHHALVLQRLAAVAPADCAVSSITTYELYTGIEKCADPRKSWPRSTCCWPRSANWSLTDRPRAKLGVFALGSNPKAA